MLHGIRDLYDAYRFMMQTDNLVLMEYSLDTASILIDALLSINRSEDAIGLIDWFRNDILIRRETIRENLRVDMERLRESGKKEPNQRDHTEQLKHKLLEHNVEAGRYNLEKQQCALDQFDEIEALIRSGHVADRIAAYQRMNAASVAGLARGFTKAERDRMVNNWRR